MSIKRIVKETEHRLDFEERVDSSLERRAQIINLRNQALEQAFDRLVTERWLRSLM